MSAPWPRVSTSWSVAGRDESRSFAGRAQSAATSTVRTTQHAPLSSGGWIKAEQVEPPLHEPTVGASLSRLQLSAVCAIGLALAVRCEPHAQAKKVRNRRPARCPLPAPATVRVDEEGACRDGWSLCCGAAPSTSRCVAPRPVRVHSGRGGRRLSSSTRRSAGPT